LPKHFLYGLQHVLIRHAPWFVQEYGSLAVWNNQGMEKSHHAAKSSLQHHTQHGGTERRTSAIVQQYQHWYRNIQHRFANKAKLREISLHAPTVDANKAQITERKRLAYHSSGANVAHAAWTATRIRVGSRWVGRAVEVPPASDSTVPEEVVDETVLDEVVDDTTRASG
jgi:hypothetical protein